MLNATLPRSTGPTAADVRPSDAAAARVVDMAAQLADAVAEFDAALDEGRPMHVLVQLDREVTAAGRRHRAALATAHV